MSGLEGLSLACNVMQLMDFSQQTVSMCRSIYESGKFEPGLEAQASSLQDASSEVMTLLRSKRVATAKTTGAERRLLDLAPKCIQHAKDLQEEIAYLTPRQPGRMQALVATSKAVWRKRRLERLKANLADGQKLMETLILVRIFARVERMCETDPTSLARIDQRLTAFISRYSEDHSALRRVVRDESEDVRGHVTVEASKTRDSVSLHVTARLNATERSIKQMVSTSNAIIQDNLVRELETINVAASSEQDYHRLLQSLKYTDMNERKNSVRTAHSKTFEWILKDNYRRIDKYTIAGSQSDVVEIADVDQNIRDNVEDNGSDEATIVGSENGSQSDIEGKDRGSETSFNDCTQVPLWDNFVEWLRGNDRNLYWVSGKPGSGKSTLMRFIETSEDTLKIMAEEYSNPRVLSHFVWKPGRPMQRSLKGVVCSLLYQALEADRQSCNTLLARFPRLLYKGSDTDWTYEELKSVLLSLLRNCSQRYLILLDGLDEMAFSVDGEAPLLCLLDDLITNQYVKLCVSSRPEPVFQRYLSKHPMLMMQSLNILDIRKYAEDSLQMLKVESVELLDQLSREVVLRSEGVFLWVVLVLESVKRGLANGDTLDIIYSRIRSLPRDLKLLYLDMWSRSNGDSIYYKQEAILYFQLVMETNRYSKPSICSLLQLATSSNTAWLDNFEAQSSVPSIHDVMVRCRNVFQTLSTRCLGLLQVQTMDRQELVDFQDDDPGFWSNTSVGFTHRTAVDFLVDDEDGRRILEGHALKPDELFSKQVKTILLTACFFKPEYRVATKMINAPHREFFTGQMFTRLFLHKEDSISAATLHSLLSLVYRHADAIIPHPQKRFISSQQKFLAIATYFGISDWITELLESIEESGGEMQLFVLRTACAPFSTHFPHRDRFGPDEKAHLPRRLNGNEHWISEVATRQDLKRETLIREILLRCSQPTSQAEAKSFQNSGPQHDTTYGGVLNSWRCFLVHNLQGIADVHFLHMPDTDNMWAEKMQTLQSFLSAGISPHVRHQKYVICVGFLRALGLSNRAVVTLRSPRWLPGVECDVYLEVNDDFLLSSILDNMSKRGVQEHPIARTDLQPFVRVVMFRTWTRFASHSASSFKRASNVGNSDSAELFAEIMSQVPGQDLSIYERLVAQAEFVLDGAEDIVDGLKAAGYELNEVDTTYECLHEKILW
ncbi:hypothetical protein CGCS363_v008430 [Colletotrichum siamense]|uniref:uncharacterized protein n=1 Tax=Colletotrichum siamense TaxID=690259 RepID=UPI0018733A9D|nr:uncharacterized protein CGCS363_v008430 [Colletotrichum siamense]KAF5498000.1 hypothetical protein CGCS363_v008430 [Colletotrichum siamense]